MPPTSFARRFDLVAVQHVERHQHVFERRHRRAFANIVFAEALQRRRAHLHQAVQFVHRVRAGIPEMRARCSTSSPDARPDR